MKRFLTVLMIMVMIPYVTTHGLDRPDRPAGILRALRSWREPGEKEARAAL